MMDSNSKPIHTIVLDTAPLLLNTPPLSSLLAKCETLVSCPSVLGEIRDAAARHRVETLYLPLLTLRSPRPESIRHVSDFAQKSGDKSVLSGVDLEVLALAYELECERNGGDWRLRNEPGQKAQNGKSPSGKAEERSRPPKSPADVPTTVGGGSKEPNVLSEKLSRGPREENLPRGEQGADIAEKLELTSLESDNQSKKTERPEAARMSPEQNAVDSSSGSDDEGWITPSNIKKIQAQELSKSTSTDDRAVLQVATVTTDFAMQNVLLRMNLNLLSHTNLQRVRYLKTFILRCHACFLTTKEMDKQFCPRCGKPTLTRVSCSTNSKGEFNFHLKKNFQWNHRGDRYSIPKPVHGSANGKLQNGGGKGGWGKELILAEDQKEYVRALKSSDQKNSKQRDLMDEDYLPGIMTRERNRGSGKIKIGAGRTVNSRKR